jgi:HPt (histidine-containing phosphotransfer) domain-containing protein
MVPEQSTLAAELAKLRNDYMQRLPAELAALQTLASSLNGGKSDRAQLTELHLRLHKLAGVPGVFELTALSTEARSLEYRIKDWLDAPLNKVDARARQTLAADVAALGTKVTT